MKHDVGMRRFRPSRRAGAGGKQLTAAQAADLLVDITRIRGSWMHELRRTASCASD
jgi:hypothetical protein